MRHETGLHALKHGLESKSLLTESIKQNSVGWVIEVTESINPPGYKRIYHKLTRDWVANEIFRRVEPQRRTMGEYMRDYFCKEFGLNIVLGATEHDMSNIYPVKNLGIGKNICNMASGPDRAPVSIKLSEIVTLGKMFKKS